MGQARLVINADRQVLMGVEPEESPAAGAPVGLRWPDVHLLDHTGVPRR